MQNQVSKKVLVTGGAGFIGRHLVKKLVERGYQVRVLDLMEKPAEFSCKIEFIRGSILNKEVVRTAVSDVDEVYHLAAISTLWLINKDIFYQVNSHGTKIVLNECHSAGVGKIIYTSTGAVLKSYKNKNHELINETSKMPDLTDMPGHYSRSKWLADREAKNAIKAGAPVVIVYPTTPIGSGDINYTPPTRMILDFLKGTAPAYLDCWLNLISVEEVALGHMLAAENGVTGEGYILANRNLKLSNILKILEDETDVPMPRWKIPYSVSLASAYIFEFIAKRITKKTPPASVEGVRMGRMKMKFDNTKARSELGLPAFSVYDAIISCARWLQKRNDLKFNVKKEYLISLNQN